MNQPIDHERCSELLLPFVEGTLDVVEEQEVHAHLGTCTSCKAEESALRLLTAPIDDLGEEESSTLRANVLSALPAPSTSDTATVVVLPQRRWGALRILGAAAVLIVAVVFVRSIGSFGQGDQAAVGVAEDAGPVAEIRDRLAFRRPPSARSITADAPAGDAAQTEQFGLEESGDEDGGGGSAAGGASADRAATRLEAPRPLYVRGAGRLDDRRLTLVGRYGLPMVLIPQVYTAADAVELQRSFLAQLANAAETDDQAQQVLDCGSQVLAQTRSSLPALATFGNYRGAPTFVLALAWTDASQGPLDQYMVWTWPAGDCAAVPGYRAGAIGV